MDARFAALFLFLTPAIAQVTQETCTIEGRITRLGTNAPLRKASVGLYVYSSTRSQFETGTDNDGHYCFVDIRPGEYRVAAEQAGYMRREFGAGRWQAHGTIFQLSRNQRQTANIELIPRGGIRGRVTDNDGDTVPTARVTALRVIYRNGRRDFVQAADTDCDEAGEFKLSNLSPGKYLVRAVARVQPPPPKIPGRPVDPGEAYGPTFYPGVTDVASAAVIEVTPGNVYDGATIGLRRGRLFRVRGRVQRNYGNPAVGATVMLGEMTVGTVSFRQDLVQTTKSPDGAFEFTGVWGGQYFIQVRDTQGSDLDGYAFADAGSRDVDFLNITLGETARLDGAVTVLNREITNLSGLRLDLEPIDGFLLGSPTAQIDESGQFRIPRMKPGRFAVNVRGLPPTAYIRSIRYGSQELDPPILDVRYGVGARLEVVVSNRSAVVSGQLQSSDGRPMAGAAICLLPENQRSTLYRTAISGDDGSYRITGIVPGKYQLAAVSDLEPGAEQEPEFLIRVGPGARKLDLPEGANEVIRLSVVER